MFPQRDMAWAEGRNYAEDLVMSAWWFRRPQANRTTVEMLA